MLRIIIMILLVTFYDTEIIMIFMTYKIDTAVRNEQTTSLSLMPVPMSREVFLVTDFRRRKSYPNLISN